LVITEATSSERVRRASGVSIVRNPSAWVSNHLFHKTKRQRSQAECTSHELWRGKVSNRRRSREFAVGIILNVWGQRGGEQAVLSLVGSTANLVGLVNRPWNCWTLNTSGYRSSGGAIEPDSHESRHPLGARSPSCAQTRITPKKWHSSEEVQLVLM